MHPADLRKGQQGQQGQGRPLRRTRWTAAELIAHAFPAPKYAVPGVLAEGVNLLAGAPKIGKSWLAFNLAVDIASGGKAFGHIDVAAGDVLYLALEDTGRRLQNRLRKILGDQPAPSRLTLETSCPPFPEGAAHIRHWLNEEGRDARLVVIDVFAKMRGTAPNGTSAYDADYTAVGHAKAIADEYGIAVLLVHHVRKAASDDFLTEVSGTNGIAGAADAILVLKRSRGAADGVLHVTGRDVDEAEYALTFAAEAGRWTALPGPAIEHLVSETRATILGFVRSHADSGPKQIADGTGLAYELTKRTCLRMAEDGQLINEGRGRYRAVPDPSVPAVPTVPFAGQGPAELSLPVSLPATAVPSSGHWRRSGEPIADLAGGAA